MKKAIKGLSVANLVVNATLLGVALVMGFLAFAALVAGIFVDIFAFGGGGFQFLTIIFTNPEVMSNFSPDPILLIPFYLLFLGGLFTIISPAIIGSGAAYTILSVMHLASIKKGKTSDEIKYATGLVLVGGVYCLTSGNYLRAILSIVAGVLSLIQKDKPEEVEQKEEPAEEEVEPAKKPSKMEKIVRILNGFTNAESIFMVVGYALTIFTGIMLCAICVYFLIKTCSGVGYDGSMMWYLPIDFEGDGSISQAQTMFFFYWLIFANMSRFLIINCLFNSVMFITAFILGSAQNKMFKAGKYNQMVKFSAISSVFFAVLIFLFIGVFRIEFLLFGMKAILSFIALPKKENKPEIEEQPVVEEVPAE